jgi:hypothetical protein
VLGEWRSWGDKWQETGDKTELRSWGIRNGWLVVEDRGLNNIGRGDMVNCAWCLLMNLTCDESTVLALMLMKDVAEVGRK